MERIISLNLEKWKNGTNRKPLIFSGARQIGKSYSIREFGTKHFENIIEINFEKRRDLHAVFEFNLDAARITNELEILLGVDIMSGKNLLFFDEVQSCPNALQSLRYFYEDIRHIPIIAAGSLLDFEFRNISFPVGRVEFLQMYPMNFQEFLYAVGQEKLWQFILNKDIIPEHIQKLIYELLDDYFFVGGMPEVVQTYVLEKDYSKVQKIQGDLLYAYENDFSKYQPVVNKDCLLEILGGLAKNIGSQVIYTKLSNHFSSITVKKGVTVLNIARLIHKVQNVAIGGVPLLSSGKQFKMIFSDIGLLSKLCGITPSDRILKDKWTAHFKGFMAEQFVGQELLIKYNKLQYWARTEPGANSEVDYIIVEDGNILPIEVKAGEKGSLKSLHTLFEKHPHIEQAIVLSKSKIGQIEKIKFVPLYKVGLL
jgi:predicted AAA+ superfamily ATPase